MNEKIISGVKLSCLSRLFDYKLMIFLLFRSAGCIKPQYEDVIITSPHLFGILHTKVSND